MNFTLDAAVISRFWSKVDRSGEHWLWIGAVGSNGYGSMGIDGKTVYAHHIAYRIQHGELPGGHMVRHRCDIKLCMRGECLLSGTHADNMADRQERNRTSKGSEHSKIMKKKAARGDRNGSCTRPESRPRGDQHFFRRNPGFRAGSRSPTAKLTEEDVTKIRYLVTVPGVKKKDVAKDFGISAPALTAIIQRKTWRHIP